MKKAFSKGQGDEIHLLCFLFKIKSFIAFG